MIQISKSEKFKSEYSAKFIRVPKIEKIPDADSLGVTFINGMSIVVRIVGEGALKEGDLALYCANETQLDAKFLAYNNQYSDMTMNMDPNIKGYFDKNGRVKYKKLRGVLSWGVLYDPSTLAVYGSGGVKDEWIDEEFDTINGELFVKAFVPKIKKENTPSNSSKASKSGRRAEKFDRIVPGQFRFHYDTTPLANMKGAVDVNDKITVSVKVHGTSGIFANVLTKFPIERNAVCKYFVKCWNKLSGITKGVLPSIDEYKLDYDVLYSSRKIIRNEDILKNYNLSCDEHYYSSEYEQVYKLIKDFIPFGVTVYGEIAGYKPNGQAIQSGYDYGCDMVSGPNLKFYPYRMTYTNAEGEVKEWNLEQVLDWTKSTIAQLPEDKKKFLEPIPMCYIGSVGYLIGDFECDRFVATEKLIDALKSRWHMEKSEPLCKNQVPREGLVVRITDDAAARAFKLKTDAFRVKEAKLISAGEVDQEMDETYE